MKPTDFTRHKHVAAVRGVQGGRVPVSCPPGFQGRYTVKPGDTMFFIAKRFGVSLDSLISANPHITDPNLIFPGDVLCVPDKLALPCCAIMKLKIQPIPGCDPGGIVLAELLPTNQQSISILAVRLPDPEDLNDFDGYQGVVQVPEQAEITFSLLKVQDNPSLWAGTKIIAPILTLDTKILVRAYKIETGTVGPTVLSTDLKSCRAANVIGCGC